MTRRQPAAPDDDALIDRLRARAWDPGLRFDRATVPAAWIRERHGADHMERIRPHLLSYGSDGTVQLPSQRQEVADHFAEAPRGPLFAPLTRADVDEAERRIGRRLPGLLRRVYTEVADGGFGPDGGLASLARGNRAPGHLSDWPCAVDVHERNRAAGVPASWFFLTGGGCSMEWYVSLAAVGHPVLLHDADGWVADRGEGPHDGLRYATASLRRWLWTWADGDNVWDEVFARRRVGA
ncbi:SMI1/KNR4 family protein [Streptomyces virginiae]|uniref:SMI1/KNR4 family protein n=1 Tax=Streptomyces TaxID=1883 RepID=UPI0006ADC09A|nr:MULTISPECIES: SMI1/KNR4 family protein [unclassified Streptomyces]